MRWLTLALLVLIASLQYPLWIGKGSWLRVWDLSRQIDKQVEVNNGLKARNEGLDAEVSDLKQGFAAIEERARSELGMVKNDEVFYQVMDSGTPPLPTKPPPIAPAVKNTLTPGVPSMATPPAAIPPPSKPAAPVSTKAKSPAIASVPAMGNHKP
jgi:cell division protein FtsB